MVDPSGPAEKAPGKVDRDDRRTKMRLPCLETSRQLVAAVGDDFYMTKIRNISPDGISLILGQPLETGTNLMVDLIDTKTNRFSRTLEVRVCWCVEHPSGDWILGGSFNSPLSEEEMDYFLK